MRDWYKYWNSAPLINNEDLFYQVGKTINGKPISDSQLDFIVREIHNKLELNKQDRVLDLCCGNGVITHRIARYCSQITAVDFSAPLINVAKQHFSTKNIEFIVSDVCALPNRIKKNIFSKIYMYEALQHLSLEQAAAVFTQITELPGAKPVLYFGSVPDMHRIWNFYNTPERREDYEKRLLDGTEAIGHWWDQHELAQLAMEYGFKVRCTIQPNSIHGAHYRFDALCIPQ